MNQIQKIYKAMDAIGRLANPKTEEEWNELADALDVANLKMEFPELYHKVRSHKIDVAANAVRKEIFDGISFVVDSCVDKALNGVTINIEKLGEFNLPDDIRDHLNAIISAVTHKVEMHNAFWDVISVSEEPHRCNIKFRCNGKNYSAYGNTHEGVIFTTKGELLSKKGEYNNTQNLMDLIQEFVKIVSAVSKND